METNDISRELIEMFSKQDLTEEDINNYLTSALSSSKDLNDLESIHHALNFLFQKTEALINYKLLNSGYAVCINKENFVVKRSMPSRIGSSRYIEVNSYDDMNKIHVNIVSRPSGERIDNLETNKFALSTRSKAYQIITKSIIELYTDFFLNNNMKESDGQSRESSSINSI